MGDFAQTSPNALKLSQRILGHLMRRGKYNFYAIKLAKQACELQRQECVAAELALPILVNRLNLRGFS